MLNDDILSNLTKRIPFYKKNIIHDIFSWDELERLLNLRPFNSATRFKPTILHKFNWPLKSWLTDKDSWPPNMIRNVIQHGSCHLCDASRVNKSVNEICDDIEKSTGYSCDAHIYFSVTNGSKNEFGLHYDTSENLIVQIEGSSNFKVWNNPVDYETSVKRTKPNSTKKEVTDEWHKIHHDLLIDITMEKGDVIFIPSYYWHEVTSISNRLSISFPFARSDKLGPQERDWIDLKALIV